MGSEEWRRRGETIHKACVPVKSGRVCVCEHHLIESPSFPSLPPHFFLRMPPPVFSLSLSPSYIKNCPTDITDESLESTLGAYGAVVNVEHRADRDFAFVTFETYEGAESAVSVGQNEDGWLFEHRTGRKPESKE